MKTSYDRGAKFDLEVSEVEVRRAASGRTSMVKASSARVLLTTRCAS